MTKRKGIFDVEGLLNGGTSSSSITSKKKDKLRYWLLIIEIKCRYIPWNK